MKTIIMAWMGMGMAFPANLHKHNTTPYTAAEIYVIVHSNAYRVVCAKQAQK